MREEQNTETEHRPQLHSVIVIQESGCGREEKWRHSNTRFSLKRL